MSRTTAAVLTLMVGSLGFSTPFRLSTGPRFASCLDCDGRHVVGLTHSNKLAVWDALTGRSVRILEGYQEPIYLARLLSDGTSVLGQTYQLGSGPPTWGTTDKTPQDHSMRVWNIETGKVIWRIPDSFFDAISRDGQRVYGVEWGVSLNGEKPRVACWDLLTGSPLFTLSGYSPLGYLSNIVEESSDGRRLLYSDPFKVAIFDLKSRKKLAEVHGGRGVGVPPTALVADGLKFFYTSPSTGGSLMLYSISNNKLVRSMAIPSGYKTFRIGWLPKSTGCVAFCNGRWKTYTDSGGLVDLGHGGDGLLNIIVSPDERSFATSYMTQRGDTRAFKVEGYRLKPFKKLWERSGEGIKFLSNGQLVIEDGDSISFVDMDSGHEERTIHLEGFFAKNESTDRVVQR